MINSKHVRRRFDRAAASFDEADFVHTVTRDGLLSRLDPLLVDARTVIDLASATGSAHRQLARRYPRSRLIAVDIAHNMLLGARRKKPWRAKYSYVQSAAEALPFANDSVDVVFANMLLPWVGDPARTFDEVARVLRKGGVFAFATLGPDSLQEIARAWRSVDDHAHINSFLDMHILGDGLVNAGFADPVLDVDRLTVSYDDSARLFADLTAAGARNSLQNRSVALTGRRRFSSMVAELKKTATAGKIQLNLELVYGHCWGRGPKNDPANYRIDAARIPVRRR